MSSFVELFGDKLKKGSSTVETASHLEGKVVGVYFSAHWCPPCRAFTPVLAKSYRDHLSEKGMEIVFVSSDQSAGQFEEYFGEMPWAAVPFEKDDVRSRLGSKFGVRGIPTFVVLDKDGSIITKDGREAVGNDPRGDSFPWRPLSFDEALGSSFTNAAGETVPRSALEGKVLGLYFSAHWCGPCRAFTPQLAAKYSAWVKEGPLKDKFEVVFISSDRGESQFKEYLGEMPWLAMPFSNRAGKAALSKRFDVSGIPTLVIVGPDGKVINPNGRAALAGDDTGAGFPWAPPPAGDLNADPSGINDKPAVIALLAGASSEEVAKAKAAVTKVAEATKAAKGDAAPLFFYETTVGRVSTQIRGLTSLAEQKPQLLVLDIPDNGGYYVSEASEVTEDTVGAFVEAYTAGALTRKQLQHQAAKARRAWFV